MNPFFSSASSNLEAALDYAARGIPVFPCEHSWYREYPADIVIPLVKSVESATTDAETVKKWWKSFPGAMVGIMTGLASGLFVVELTRKGLEEWGKFAVEYEFDPDETLFETPYGGGRRYYYRFPIHDGRTPACTTEKLASGINTKGEGGYVSVSPSSRVISPPGDYDDHEIQYVAGENREIKPLPGALLDLVLKTCTEDQPKKVNTADQDTQAYRYKTQFGSMILRNNCNAIVKYAGDITSFVKTVASYVAGGEINGEFGFDAVLSAALEAGFQEDEARKACQNGFSRGLREPRRELTSTSKNTPSNTASTVPKTEELFHDIPKIKPSRGCTQGFRPYDLVLPGLPIGKVGSITCAGGGGKSMLILQCCVGIAIGGTTPITGDNNVTQGKCLLLPVEENEQDINNRLHFLHAYHKFAEHQLKNMDANFMILDLCGAGVSPDICDNENEKWVSFISEAGQGCRLIVLDTLRRFHILNENDSGQMALLISRMETIAHNTGASVVFLHHTNKSAALNGNADIQQSARGSSVLTDNIRWQSYLSSMTKEEAEKYTDVPGGSEIGEERGYFVRFGIAKQNCGSPIRDIWLKRLDGGILAPINLFTIQKKYKDNGDGI